MKSFKQFFEVNGKLYLQLVTLKPKIAFAAQEVYNSWEQDEEGMDVEVGGGGVCDEISKAIAHVVAQNIHDAEMSDGGQDGDDHAWLIVYNMQEAYGVDIPHYVYERGGGYSWQKIPNVKFSPNDVEIFQVDHPEEE